jgi:hypothetical protein
MAMIQKKCKTSFKILKSYYLCFTDLVTLFFVRKNAYIYVLQKKCI